MKKITIYTKLPKDVYDQLKKLCKADNRALSNYIQIVLTEHVTRKQPKK